MAIYAVVKTGGKQYLVTAGEEILVDRLKNSVELYQLYDSMNFINFKSMFALIRIVISI